ncbi:MAG: protein-L-isoaspartate(D-aspartate) O-methyltransferase [Thermodesulfovibrionales bacterium]
MATIDDYKYQRDVMVDTQLIPRGISDRRVIDAMRSIPRHLFVPKAYIQSAYNDMALPIGDGQTISQPYMVAVMTEKLEVNQESKVLEIGTGSGYQTAVLATLAYEVYTIERIESLSHQAEQTLTSLGFKNIHFIVGDGSLGYDEAKPYDRVLITAGAPAVPQPIKDQLADGGIIVAPVGDRFSQTLIILKKVKGAFTVEYSTGCVFVPLLGKHGWMT